MTKVNKHIEYQDEFPETFTWAWVDSNKLANIACVIKNYIENDLKSDRNLVPGLRLALKIISDVAEV